MSLYTVGRDSFAFLKTNFQTIRGCDSAGCQVPDPYKGQSLVGLEADRFQASSASS